VGVGGGGAEPTCSTFGLSLAEVTGLEVVSSENCSVKTTH